jgi:hypothetical protein
MKIYSHWEKYDLQIFEFARFPMQVPTTNSKKVCRALMGHCRKGEIRQDSGNGKAYSRNKDI